jgi:hypothetical protein
LLEQLGNSFRGLWRSFPFIGEEDPWPTGCYTVTFIYKGQYVETPNFDTPEECLEFAIRKNNGPVKADKE